MCTTPLWGAVTSTHAEVVRVLLKYCADPNVPNHKGFSPVRFAITRFQEEIANMLREAGGRDFINKG